MSITEQVNSRQTFVRYVYLFFYLNTHTHMHVSSYIYVLGKPWENQWQPTLTRKSATQKQIRMCYVWIAIQSSTSTCQRCRTMLDRSLHLIIFSALNINRRMIREYKRRRKKRKEKYFFLFLLSTTRLCLSTNTSNGKSVAKRTQLFHGIFIIDFYVYTTPFYS